MKTIAYNKGNLIFRQGEDAREMFDILSGSVGVFAGYGTENENQLAVLRKGDLLGEMGVIEAYPRSATAVALEEETTLRVISDEEFVDYFKDQPERVLEIMRQLSQRLRNQDAAYEAAVKTLDEMEHTEGAPDERSKSLKDRIREYFDFYDKWLSGETIHFYDW